MTRRTAILAVLSLPLGYWKAFAAQEGWLTVDLGQWRGIEVRFQGKKTVITPAEIFDAVSNLEG